MFAIVTIEVGYEHSTEDDLGSKNYSDYTGVLDIRRVTNMGEVVRTCRLTCGLEINKILSEVHFKMLTKESGKIAIFPRAKNSPTDIYFLKCKKYTDRKTGIGHTLTISVKPISVPRLESGYQW